MITRLLLFMDLSSSLTLLLVDDLLMFLMMFVLFFSALFTGVSLVFDGFFAEFSVGGDFWGRDLCLIIDRSDGEKSDDVEDDDDEDADENDE